MTQKKEEWNKREKERMQRQQEKSEIDRCLHYGRMFSLDEDAWQGEADTMEDLAEVIASIEKERWDATLSLQAS
jgi:dihydroneopterin aldolase